MKPSYLACAFLALAAGVCVGFWVRGPVENSGTFLAAKSLPQLDYFVVPESFSRIENAKKHFDGLCTRLRLEIENRLTELRSLRLRPGASQEEEDIRLSRIIRDLEEGIAEFEGTDQELYLTEDLFYALKRGARYGRWVDVYLKALYKHPTHPVVARFSAQAVSVGNLIGREADVIAGLSSASQIPLDFPGKAKIQAALDGAKKREHLTRADERGEAANRLIGFSDRVLD